jgi:hypothetical protein
MIKIAAWIGGILVILVVAIAIQMAHRTELVAQSEIAVDSYPVPNRKVGFVGKIREGQQVAVLGCDDLKSDRAVHVRLESGIEGYVLQGKYYLRRSPIWSSVDSPMSFCPSMWP